MRHPVFGEIAYQKDDLAWEGSCRLPAFAEYGRLAPDDHALSEPAPEFRHGLFALTIQDAAGDGPSVEQANAFAFVRDREADVCRAVMTQVVNACDMRGGIFPRLTERRATRLWGWLAGLLGPEYRTPDDFKRAARCLGVEVSSRHDGGFAYVAFSFETAFGVEAEHGLSVVFHPGSG